MSRAVMSRGFHVAASMLVAAALVGGCTTTVAGSAVIAPGGPPNGVDVELLDTGNYPTKPAPPLGNSGRLEGRIVDAQRMAGNIIGPWEVDPALTAGTGMPVLLLQGPPAIGLIAPGEVAIAADHHNFINGFVSDRRDDKRRLSNAVLRFPDPPAAAAAAAEMGDAALKAQVQGPPVNRVPIPGHPDAFAVSHEEHFGGYGPALEGMFVRSFTAHGPYVLYQFAIAKDGLDAATALIAKAIDLQGPLIDKFAPTDPAKFADLPRDPTGLLARTLPIEPAGSAMTWQRAVYDARGGLHFQDDPVRSAKTFTDTGTEFVSINMTSVYQVRDDDAAVRMRDVFADEVQAKGAKPAERVNFMPASRCVQSEGTYYCVAPADRYLIEASAPQLVDAHQRVAAQYRMLVGQ